MPYAPTAAGSLHYEVIDLVAPWVANRQTIVFHHGIGADPGIWAEWIPALAGRYRIVTFDMRGYGRSHILPADFEWSLDLVARDVFAVAKAAGCDRFHLVGESIGGTIALYCAITRPERIQSLVVSNGAHLGASIQRAEAWRTTIDTQGIAQWSREFLDDRFEPGAIDEARLAWFDRCQQAWPRDSILNALGVLIGSDMRPQLPQIGCPVLLMHGDASPYIPVSVMADLHARLTRSRLQVFAGARHGLPFSHAAPCAALVRAFLDQQAVPSTK